MSGFDEEDYDFLYKVVLVGDSGVGKSHLMQRFIDDNVGQDRPTIGVEFGTQMILHTDGQTRIKVWVWDTAGQERYRAITSSHYRRAVGAFIVYDVSNRESFENAVKLWHGELRDKGDENTGLMNNVALVGNKIDLENNGAKAEEAEAVDFVDPSLHEGACKSLGMMSARVSALTGHGVHNMFQNLIITLHDKLIQAHQDDGGGRDKTGAVSGSNGGSIHLATENQKATMMIKNTKGSRGGCC